MPNEFIIKNGYRSQGNSEITGSLKVTGGITGSLFGTASWAENARTASYVNPLTQDVIITGSLYISGSVNNVEYIDFNTGSVTPPWKSGRVFWDNVDGALSVYNAEADITLQVGQENWTRVRNNTGTTILNGTVVRVIGSQGDAPTIERAQSIPKSGSINLDTQILGVATHTIEDSSFGYVTTQGLVRGLNTNAFNDGETLFVGTGSAGVLQNIAPIAPYEIIPVGVCVKASPGTSGIIYVAVQQPLDFADLSTVEKTGTYSYGDLWTYVPSGSFGVWRHTNQLSGSYSLTGSLNVTGSANIIGTLTLTGSLDATGSFSVTGIQTYTGSFNVSGSFGLIGPQTNTGSLFITGSSTDKVELLIPLTSSQNISSSLDVIARTGSFDYLLDRGDAVIDGDLIINGALTLAGGLQFGPTFATGSLIANTNNLLIPNLANSILVRLTSAGNFQLTGIVVPDNTKTYFFNVFNVGTSGNIIFKNNDIGSTAQNRFLVGADITVQPGEGLSFIYDPVDLRWRSPGKNI
jgi:cytoskeletal protein CcmA (bactofilin family)